MKHWRQTIKSLLIPQLTLRHFAYRFPFYVNLVCWGYLRYWSHKAELAHYPASDATGIMGTVALIACASWIAAAILLFATFGRRKTRDYVGLAYLCLTLYMAVHNLHLQLGPSG